MFNKSKEGAMKKLYLPIFFFIFALVVFLMETPAGEGLTITFPDGYEGHYASETYQVKNFFIENDSKIVFILQNDETISMEKENIQLPDPMYFTTSIFNNDFSYRGKNFVLTGDSSKVGEITRWMEK